MSERTDRRDQSSTQRWSDVMSWFERWLDLDAPGQAQLLAELAAKDADLHARVVDAIKTDRDADSLHFLEDGALVDVGRVVGQENTLLDRHGEHIGPWRIVRLLGVGGMGQVWLVERSDGMHAGRAALKMLRFAAIDRMVQQRFAREGELLARLQHPHVARLLDVGESREGQRYLVLEYVDGVRIDDWCDARRATIAERLRLFEQICDAIAYAHGNLIVHRDLKPSNILVQADGSAKVLDFGMAKLLEGDELAGAMTELTRAAGAAFTPEYAAPEQFSGDLVTVATDVYSLGAVLHVLLVGRRPHGEEDATPAQLARAVGRDELRRPSSRVAETTGETLDIAQARSTTPEQLRRLLRGDIDTILAKALKRNAHERYATVQQFADDIRRYLDRRPIAARADSAAYRLRKYVGRHLVGVSIGALLVLAVLAGVVGIAWEARIARHEASRAETEAAKSAHIASFTSNMLSSVDPNRAKTMDRTLMRSVLDTAAADAQRELANEPSVRQAIENTIATSYYSIGEAALAADHWTLALAAAREAGAGVGAQARILGLRSSAENGESKYREALTTANEGYALAATLPADDADRLYATSRLAATECSMFHSKDCLAHFEAAYDGERRILGDNDPETLLSLTGIAAAQGLLGDNEAMRARYKLVARGYAAHYGDSDSHTLSAVARVAQANDATGHFVENEKLISDELPIARKILGPTHPVTLNLASWLGISICRQGRYAEAKTQLLDTLELYRESAKGGSFTAMSVEISLVDALIGLHELDDAERHARDLVERIDKMSGGHGDGGLTRTLLGAVLLRQKRFAEAEHELQSASAQQQTLAPGAQMDIVASQTVRTFVDLYAAWGKPDLAAEWRKKLAAAEPAQDGARSK